MFRQLSGGWPPDDFVGEHRPPAGHEVVLIRVIQAQPAVALVHRPVPGRLVHRQPGPPALPVLLVPLGPLAVQVSRPGRRGYRVKVRITTAPATAAADGEPVLGQDPQRGRRRRRAQPGRPGHLGAARLGAVEHLVDERGRPAQDQERRVYPVDAASSPT